MSSKNGVVAGVLIRITEEWIEGSSQPSSQLQNFGAVAGILIRITEEWFGGRNGVGDQGHAFHQVWGKILKEQKHMRGVTGGAALVAAALAFFRANVLC